MNESHKELISIGLTIAIVAITLFIIHRFIPSLIWAAIIVISTHPLYQRWERIFDERRNLSAFLFTTILALLLFIPVSWLVTVLVKELQLFINYLQLINREGGQVPTFIRDLPFIGKELVSYWDANIAQPGNLKYLLSNLHLSLTPASYYIKQIGLSLAHRSFQVGFTLLSLFFLYRDGDKLFKQINYIGESCLGARWFPYIKKNEKEGNR